MTVKPIKGEGSLQRVVRAAELHGLPIEISEMDQSTRTAEEAAQACNCETGQIVKSLIFERVDDRKLVLVLVSGSNNADSAKLEALFSTRLEKADPRKVREITGFAIGGVAPIGHLENLQAVLDEDLMNFEEVWAAAGKPNAVFKVKTKLLAGVLQCRIADLKSA